MPPSQPWYETPADANGLMYYVIQCCWSVSRLNMSILTICRPPFFTEMLQPLPSTYCWCRCPSFSPHFCKSNIQKLLNSLNKLQLRVAVTSSSLLVSLQLDSQRYSLDGSYRPHLQYTRANAPLDNTGGEGGKENKRTNGQKMA
jgi:hypothetical protein